MYALRLLFERTNRLASLQHKFDFDRQSKFPDSSG